MAAVFPSVIDQVVFDWELVGMRVVACSAEDAATRDRWAVWLARHTRLMPHAGGAPPWALSYLRGDGDEAAVLRRWRPPGWSPGRNPAHALIGPADVLTSSVALGLADWSGWARVPRRVWLPTLTGAQLPSGDADRAELRGWVRQHRGLVARVLATLVQHSDKPMTVVGTPDDAVVPLMRALHVLGRAYLARVPSPHGWERRWTFSTYEDDLWHATADPPEVVFLPAPPRAAAPVHRAVVDVGAPRGPGESLWAQEQAEALIAELVHSDEPGPDAATSLPAAGWSAPRHQRPEPPAPLVTAPAASDPGGEPLAPPPGWYHGADRDGRWYWDGRRWTERSDAPATVFVSYARSDAEAVQRLAADLGTAGLPVWLDSALLGGEPWWERILDEIRSAAVFVYAISDRSLESEPCRREHAYASLLGLPVLPVQVGPVASLRSWGVGTQQVVDYRDRDVPRVLGLLRCTLDAARRRGPLPDPLPPSPDMPHAYLPRIRSELQSEQLTFKEQLSILLDLENEMEGAGREVRLDIVGLLQELRSRPDTAVRVVRQIDHVLAERGEGEPPDGETA